MDLLLFPKGFLVGIAIAAPVGPIAALCISRTLSSGFAAGVAGGLGTALADASYALIASLGFAAFSAALETIDVPLKVAGGLFMLWLAWTTARARPATTPAPADRRSLAGTVAATYALTVANPPTILLFAAIFAGLGLADAADPASAALVVAGVFTGSMLWWIALSGGVALLRRRLPAWFAVTVSRVSAALLAGFGAVAIGSVLV